MTRKVAQYGKCSAIVALLVLMVVGIDNVFADNTVQIELDTFGELLDGVASEVLATPIQIETSIDQPSEPRAELLVHKISHLEAFQEVIQNNIF